MPKNTLDLRDKQHPSCELPKGINREWHLSYTTEGNAEATRKAGAALKERMLELMTDKSRGGLGDLPEKVKDCGLKRAFHDELGVRKVAFTFCDDMLTTVYKLESAWKLFETELHNVFKAAGVNPNHVIRCLLAELGPGVSIPVHHDTGYWATRSHRVHMPIITSSLVEFYTGKTEDSLSRVPFPEFELVELNNRAKHMVKNGWNQPRVHLIFDYVEDHQVGLLRFQSLLDSDIVQQTRRTISIVRQSEEKLNDELASEEKDQEAIPEFEENDNARTEITKKLFKKIQDAHKENTGVGSRFVREFCKLSTRYSDGEMQAAEYVAFLDRAFGNRESARDIVGLLYDRERANALQVALKSQPATLLLPSPPCPAALKDVNMFIVVGAMKCGTTSLYEYVNEHPLCVRARQKEPHAFDWVWNQLCALKGESLGDKYLKAFDTEKLLSDGPKRFTGEATPSYLLGGAEVFKRLRAACPHAKLLVILREPCERAWSHYRMTADTTNATADQLARRGTVRGKSFSTVIEEDLEVINACKISAENTIASEFEAAYLSGLPTGHGAHSYVARGFYALQIELMLQVFPREQIHFMTLETLSRDLNVEMAKVFRFIGVDAVPISKAEKHNARGEVNATRTDEDLLALAKLKDVYRDHNIRLQSLIPELDLSDWK